MNRRRFLKITGAIAAGYTLVRPAEHAMAMGKAGVAPSPDALTAERWAMVVDTRKINGEVMETMIEACNEAHNIPQIDNPKHEVKWIWDDEFEHVFPGQMHASIPPDVKKTPFPVLCNHCDEPPCVRVCPTKATFRRDDGIVLMDMHRCIGCRFCMAACPYGSRSFNWVDPRLHLEEETSTFPTRMKGVVEKCNFCAERLAMGEMPACVDACENNEMIFGDLNDPDSAVNVALRGGFAICRKPEVGTKPQVYYII